MKQTGHATVVAGCALLAIAYGCAAPRDEPTATPAGREPATGASVAAAPGPERIEASDDLPPDCRLALVLREAVFQEVRGKRGPRTRLHLDIERAGGVWRRDVFGIAWNLNRGEHFGRIQDVRPAHGRLALTVLLEVDGDPWIPGGMMPIELDLAFQGSAVTGSYAGTFRGVEVAGAVAGTVNPLPDLAPGFVPPLPGEHPRLLFRRGELPLLRARAETRRGRELVARIAEREDDGVAMGLMYQLTGEQRYADRCREILLEDRHDHSGGPWNLGHYHGPRQQRMGLTLDLAWDGLPDRFRSMIAGYLWYYTSRTLLRPQDLSRKTNFAPGSNYMGKIVSGFAAQAAIWDAPGAFPAEPRPNTQANPARRDEFTPGDGVPVVALEPGRTITQWLFAGPFYATPGTGDTLVLAERLTTPAAGEYYQHHGVDYLESLGGEAAARVANGTRVTYGTLERAFAPLPPDALVARTGEAAIDVWAAHGNVPCSVGYYYTVIETTRRGTYRLHLEPVNPEARDVNRHLGDRYETFSAKPGLKDSVTFHLDVAAYIAGTKLYHGSAVHLLPGRYPLLIRATTRQYRARLAPRLEIARPDEQRAQAASHSARYQREHPIWERFFDAYYRRPLYDIAARKLRRFDEWGQGSSGYPNESGAYHAVTIKDVLLAARVYRNVTGRPLPSIAMDLPCYVARGRGDASTFALGYPLVPAAMKPGVLWAWKRAGAFDADPVHTFLNLPDDDAPATPDAIPNPYVDRRAGFYLFRSGWDADAIVADVFFKSQAPTGWNRANAGTFSIAGFGHSWVWRGSKRETDRYGEESVVLYPDDATTDNLGGRVTHFASEGGGSGVVTAVMDGCVLAPVVEQSKKGPRAKRVRDSGGVIIRDSVRDVGRTWTRSFAVDYSGRCGAPALFVVADRTTGGTRKIWQMLTRADKGVHPEVTVDGRRFSIRRPDGTSLVGTFVAPADVEVAYHASPREIEAMDATGKKRGVKTGAGAIHAEGGDDFFVVMTLQRGAAPEIRADGAGMAARVVGRGVRMTYGSEGIEIARE